MKSKGSVLAMYFSTVCFGVGFVCNFSSNAAEAAPPKVGAQLQASSAFKTAAARLVQNFGVVERHAGGRYQIRQNERLGNQWVYRGKDGVTGTMIYSAAHKKNGQTLVPQSINISLRKGKRSFYQSATLQQLKEYYKMKPPVVARTGRAIYDPKDPRGKFDNWTGR